MTNRSIEFVINDRQLYSLTPLKSSGPSEKNTYAEAYVNACKAVKLDTNARYIEARDAYKSVVKVNNRISLASSITLLIEALLILELWRASFG